jgi:hypothetical protein
MIFSFIYLINKFTRGFDNSQLKTEIAAQFPTFIQIQVSDDSLYVLFSTDQTNNKSALDAIIESHAPSSNPGAIFDAICDTTGQGDYLLPSEAFADGRISVFLRNGVYAETSDIIIPNYGSMVGESGPGCIIFFQNVSKSIKCNINSVSITDGTISIINGTNVVTGSGTKFVGLMIGDFILISTNYCKIASIESDTELTIVDTYQGANISNMNFVASSMFTGIKLSNFIVAGSKSHGIYFRNVHHFVFDSISLKSNAPNMLLEYCGNSSLKHILCEYSNGVGLTINNCSFMHVSISDIYNGTSHGIEINGITNSIILNSCKTSNNAGNGIYIMGNIKDLNITTCIIKYNLGSGIVQSSQSSSSSLINSTVVRGNCLKGISLNGNDHIISGNIIEDNVGIGIEVISSNCLITNNLSKNNYEGIILTGNNSIASGNNSSNNTANGILVIGNNCIVTNNIATENKASGVKIETEAADTIISMNNCKNNHINE